MEFRTRVFWTEHLGKVDNKALKRCNRITHPVSLVQPHRKVRPCMHGSRVFSTHDLHHVRYDALEVDRGTRRISRPAPHRRQVAAPCQRVRVIRTQHANAVSKNSSKLVDYVLSNRVTFAQKDSEVVPRPKSLRMVRPVHSLVITHALAKESNCLAVSASLA